MLILDFLKSQLYCTVKHIINNKVSDCDMIKSGGYRPLINYSNSIIAQTLISKGYLSACTYNFILIIQNSVDIATAKKLVKIL